MISKKNKNSYWYISEDQFHKFSGPYTIYHDGDNIYCQYGYCHRLYGFADDWLNYPDWIVNGKGLNNFKGNKK